MDVISLIRTLLAAHKPEEIPSLPMSLPIYKAVSKPDYLSCLFLALSSGFQVILDLSGEAQRVLNSNVLPSQFSWQPRRLAPASVTAILSLLSHLKTNPQWISAVDSTCRSLVLSLKSLNPKSLDQSVESSKTWSALGALAFYSTQNLDSSALELSIANLCDNHDDGSTEATVKCTDCPSEASYFCAECNDVIHLSRSKRSHNRISAHLSDSPAFSVQKSADGQTAKIDLRGFVLTLAHRSLSVTIQG